MKRITLIALALIAAGCGRYRDFTLPALAGAPAAGSPAAGVTWRAQSAPVLERGQPGEWDSVDVLNPSVIRFRGEFWNLYSGFDGHTWHTGVATSPDGEHWRKRGKILSPDAGTWEGDYIAANGAALAEADGSLAYLYQAGRLARIGLARSSNGLRWTKQPQPVLEPGPRGSWDERGVADPYVVETGGKRYLFYTGMDRARRQRLGIAVSGDGMTWCKLRSNPVLEVGDYGAFDENGLGEPAVWVSGGQYWMLYCGRGRTEVRRMGLAESSDGVHWRKLPQVLAGTAPWNRAVLCDPTVLAVADGAVRVWFGGGDIPRPDENINGAIGTGILEIRTGGRP